MTQHTGAPYRPPCEGWPGSHGPYRGCYQHRRADEAAIPIRLNTSRVADWDTPAGANIKPYPRPARGTEGWPEANEYNNCPGAPPDEMPPYPGPCNNAGHEKKCGPWRVFGTEGYDERSGGSEGVDCFASDQVLDNCFATALEEGTRDYSRCRKLGWKAVRCKRAWHGTHGFTSHDPSRQMNWMMDPYCTDYSSYPYCGALWSGTFENYHDPETTKYLTMATSGSYDYDSGDPGGIGDWYATFDVSASVDPESGVVTRTVAAWDSSQPDPGEDGFFSWFDGAGGLSMRVVANSVLSAMFAEWSARAVNYWGTTGDGNFYCTWSNGSVTAYTRDPSTWDTYIELGSWSWDMDTGAFHLHSDIIDQYGWPSNGEYLDIVAVSGNTSYTLTTTKYHLSSYWITETIIQEGSLSNANTMASLYADAKALLATWNLADDVTCPWRTDEYIHIVPEVGRLEAKANVDQYDRTPMAVSPHIGLNIAADPAPTAETNNVVPWTDPMALYADGSVVGAPLSYYDSGLRGCGPYFDWEHVTWGCCTDPNTSGAARLTFPIAFGAWSGSPPGDGAIYDRGMCDLTDGLMPPEATRWTENDLNRSNYPPGWWAIVEADVLVLQKWAQIKLPWRSYNFARPCGQDRKMVAEETVRCVRDVATVGENTRVEIAAGTAINTGDLVYIDGLSDDYGVADGIYRATKIDATHYDIELVTSTTPPAGGPSTKDASTDTTDASTATDTL